MECFTVTVLQEHVCILIIIVEIDESADVLMVQRAVDLDFTYEVGFCLFALQALLMHDLDRVDRILLLNFKHSAKATLAELSADCPLTDFCASLQIADRLFNDVTGHKLIHFYLILARNWNYIKAFSKSRKSF